MLEVKEINQFYGGSHILRDVSFQAPVGGMQCRSRTEWCR